MRMFSKKSFILFLVAGLLLIGFPIPKGPIATPIAAAAEGGDLLVNPGFEEDGTVTATPTGWQTITSGGEVTTQDVGHTGSYSVKVTSTAESGSLDSPSAGIYQTFTGIEQGTYTFTAWVKSSAYSPAKLSGPDTSAYLEAKDTGAPAMRAYINGYPNADGWVQIVMRNVISYNGEVTVGLFLQQAASGMTIAVDDASLKLEWSDQNPVQNWGFENDLDNWVVTGGCAIPDD